MSTHLMKCHHWWNFPQCLKIHWNKYMYLTSQNAFISIEIVYSILRGSILFIIDITRRKLASIYYLTQSLKEMSAMARKKTQNQYHNSWRNDLDSASSLGITLKFLLPVTYAINSKGSVWCIYSKRRVVTI